MAAAESEAIANFMAITGASTEEAQAFLKEAGGDLEAAVNSYLDGNQVPAQQPSRQEAQEGQAQTAEPASRGQGQKRSNVATLKDVGDGQGDQQQYFAGGGKSGMLVEGNEGEEGDQKSQRVKGIFDSAMKHGAEQGSEADLQQQQQSQVPFTGKARTLSGEEREQPANPPEEVVHTITFYENGFLVDDGEFRKLGDPRNTAFLEALKAGQYPPELAPKNPGTTVKVNLVRKNENYEPPQEAGPSRTPFSGQARKVGEDEGPSSSGAPPAPAAPSGPPGEWHVDESQPTTSIQLRLADGSRVVGRFNHNHTVADIFKFIRTIRPGSNPTSLQLMDFPPKPLTDTSQTIKESGAAGSVVIER